MNLTPTTSPKLGEVALEEHPVAGEPFERLNTAQVNERGGDARVGQRAVRDAVGGHPAEGLAPVAPSAVVAIL